LQGCVTYMGEVLQLDVTLATPARAMSGQSIDVTVALDSRLVSVEYAGIISGGGSAAKGSLKVAGDSVKELAAWQGEPLDAGADAFNQFSLTSEVGFVDQSLALTALKATLDELEFVGETTVTLSDPPDIQAQFDLGMLDLNPYLPAEPAAADGSPAVSAAAPAQPVVWDDTPLDLAALKSVNARLTVTSSGLKAGDITLGENALQLTLKGGRMTVALEKFVAYQGQGAGEVVVDASRSPYAITTSFDLAGVNAQPLLTDAVGFDKLLGTGKLDWKLTTAGRSQKDFMGGLNGSLSFSFTDGAVKGANLAALVRSAEGIMQGDISSVSLDQGFDKAQQTDFSEMGGSMQFKQGIGNNQDLSLASPLLRIKGQGTVNLPRATVDYALNARLVESIEGQGAGEKAKGVAIPVRIKGPFHKVKIKPDVSKAAEEKVKESLKDELFKRFGNKDKKS
jgi:AsmA protein